MAKANLTKEIVDAAEPREKTWILWDFALAGFGVKIHPTGRKTYFLYYHTSSGQQRRPKIGAHGVFAPDAARKVAKQWLQRVAIGGDPSKERKESRRVQTFGSFAVKYLEHIKPRVATLTHSEHERRLKLHILPRLKGKKLGDISRGDVQRLHDGMVDHPIAANRAVSLISTMINQAIAWGYLPETHVNPAAGRRIKRNKEKSRKRYLSGDEYKRLFAAIEALVQAGAIAPPAANAVRLLALTGCRRDEILTLKWSAVNLENRVLNLPVTKTGERMVLLNGPAVAVLEGIEHVKGNPYVIPGGVKGERLVNISKPWALILKQAAIEDLHVHDLRHAYASVAVGLGLGLPAIGSLLGHTQSKTTARYSHLDNASAVAATDAIGQAIERMVRDGGVRVVDLAGETGDESKTKGGTGV